MTTLDADARRYWTYFPGHQFCGPYPTADQAIAAAFAGNGKPSSSDEVCYGYGVYGPHFDIRWVKRREFYK